jgi:hypothetical protein
MIVSNSSSASSRQEQTTEHSEENNNKEDHKTLWDSWFPDSISLYTLALVVFTAVLAFGTLYQFNFLGRGERIAADTAKAAKDSADIAREALETTQRAFIFITTFEVSVLPNTVRVQPKWQNSGTTPTIEMRSRVSWKWFPGEPPADYDYPNLDGTGNVDTAPETQTAFVGPQTSSYASSLNIPVFWIDRVRKGDGRIFIWGWGEYNDVFKGTVRHRTEFCNELVVEALNPVKRTVPRLKLQFPSPCTGNSTPQLAQY